MNDISNINFLSDKSILENIGFYIQQTRIRQSRTQEELASAAAISRSTLSQIEKGDSISLINLIKILRILDVLYVLNSFRIEEKLSPLQLAKGEKKIRQRASNRPHDQPESDLEW